jgi:hypothetical protein
MPERASHGRHVEMCRTCIEWLHISLDTLDRVDDVQKMLKDVQQQCLGAELFSWGTIALLSWVFRGSIVEMLSGSGLESCDGDK